MAFRNKLSILSLVFFLLFLCISSVPVYVMMPLDLIDPTTGNFKDFNKLSYQVKTIATSGVDGFMIDLWWGVIERSPKNYNFEAYRKIFNLAATYNLKVQVVFSFHQCGGNVGNESPFVMQVGQSQDIFYRDQYGNQDREYISLGVDDQPLFNGRTPVQMYTDLMQAFYSNFSSIIGQNKLITTLEIGLGPSGELRYPSYQSNRWTFPGVGAFQCYDAYLLQDLRKSSASIGHPEWTNPPSNAGSYNSYPPSNIDFFVNGYNSDYGKFFLNWYSQKLIDHGDKILAKASTIFASTGVSIAAKVAGIHWWYMTQSHAAELTAGYYNVAYTYDGYQRIAAMFKKYNAVFLFTCMEMTDESQQNCGCGPQELVAQTRTDAWNAGLQYAGENALEMYDDYHYNQILSQSSVGGKKIAAFTFLRLGDSLLQSDNLSRFANFVSRMHNL